MKVLLIAGTRPNFMKVAPILRRMKQFPEQFEPVLVHTGQHSSQRMAGKFIEELGLEVKITLDVPAFRDFERSSRTHQLAQTMCKLEPVILDIRPDWILVVGDVTSTLAGALCAQGLGYPLAHIEAGLRSGDRTMPEEINRILTDQLSDLCFAPDLLACNALEHEGIPTEKIHLVGNVMIDTLREYEDRAEASNILAKIGVAEGEYVVVTLHRPSNVDDPEKLAGIWSALNRIAQEIPVVFPVHPRTHRNLSPKVSSGEAPGIRLWGPLGYLDFLKLEKHAGLVLTDSGGIQEETTALRVPCLTLRDNTERHITTSIGTNSLVGTDPERIVAAARAQLARPKHGEVPALWDGRAAERIVSALWSEERTS